MVVPIEEETGMNQVLRDRIEKIKQGIVPKGYKETEIGIIPENWTIKTLKNIAAKVNEKNSENKYNRVFSNSAKNGIVIQTDYFDKEIANKSNLSNYFVVKKNDFVYNPRISIIAPYGPINRNNSGNTGLVSPLYRVFRIKNNDNDINFMEHYFHSSLWNNHMYSVANTGARHDRMNITDSDFFNLKISLPNYIEQQKIADILSTWDQAIELKKSLIKEKEKQKKGLMEKVFFFRKTKGVEEIALGKLGEVYSGLSGKSKVDFGFGEKFITYKNVFDNSKVNLKQFEEVRVEENESQNKVEYGDVLFTMSSETPHEVGMSSVMLDKVSEDYYLNSFCLGFRLNDFDKILPKYLRFYLRAKAFRGKIIRLAQGSTRFNLPRRELLKVKIEVPSVSKQKSIAEILSTADKELDLLKQEVEQLKEQKKGLMQLLLTGIVRVGEVEELE